ncbi:MAG: short-chain fatty acyl-CoA regulator family protein [Parvularculaceae bacterium]
MAAKRKLYLGPQIRRVRRDRGLTQAEMAAEIGVSASYVNLMERNQRPVSAEALVKLARAYDLDVADLASDRADDLFARLAEAFADPVFRDSGVAREDAHELAAGNPALAEAVAKLYRAWRADQQELMEARATRGGARDGDPGEAARDCIHAHGNYFDAVDRAGEAIHADLVGDAAGARGGGALYDALAARFAERHDLRARVLPEAVMAGAVRRLNRHAGDLAVSERLDQASRAFHLALQLTLIENGRLLDETVNAAPFDGDAGRRLARAALAYYGAAAILMPYDPFLAAAQELAYDLEAIARRFTASFEQVAHRLATLKREGAAGVPFFFIRIDAAGNVSKRFSADLFPFARYGGSCPLWNVHEAFRAPRRVLTQIVRLPDGATFFSTARTVRHEAVGHGAPAAERAVALGCRLEDAAPLVYAREIGLEAAPAPPIGVNCRLCERAACAARAHPPLRRRLVVDEHRRLATPFSLELD